MAALTPNEKRLDRAFSKWVRYSAATRGYVRCVTCNKLDTPDRMDAGHFIDRTHKATRWHEQNVHPQCTKCNRYHEGMKDEYALFLVKTYGPDILALLNRAKWIPHQTNDLEILELAKEYEKRYKDLCNGQTPKTVRSTKILSLSPKPSTTPASPSKRRSQKVSNSNGRRT